MIYRFDGGEVFLRALTKELRKMKTLLIIAAAVGLSATAAAAECAYHNKVSAGAEVDRSMTTASIATDEKKTNDGVLLKKGERLPENAARTE